MQCWRPFLVGASWQPGKALLGESLRNGSQAQLCFGFFKRSLDVLGGVILIKQVNDAFPGGIGLWRTTGTFRRRLEKHTLGILTELMTEDTKTAVAVAEASGGFLRW